MVEDIKYFLIACLILYYGFFFYGVAIQAFPRQKFIPKIFTGVGIAIFGILDVFLNVLMTIPFGFEPPQRGMWTFSGRCCKHLHDTNYRGSQAQAWAILLNAIVPDHIS
jgi:hypothetical protein